MAEDNEDHLELLSDALSVDNEVIGTDSRDGCMTLLAENPFDLVVLDYNLKKKFSGFDILKEITLRFPGLPVIMVTAYGSEDLAVKVMKTGARDYIRKTLDNNYIERIVNNVRDLVQTSGKHKQGIINRNQILNYLREQKGTFIDKWKKSINDNIRKSNIPKLVSIDDNQFELLLSAFLADLQNNNAIETTRIIKEFLELNQFHKNFFFILELLNTGFKDVAVDFIEKCCSAVIDYRASIYYQIDSIISENNFVIRDMLYNTLAADKQR